MKKLIFSLIVAVSLLSVSFSFAGNFDDTYDQDGNYSYGQVNPGGSVDNSDQDGNYSQGTIK